MKAVEIGAPGGLECLNMVDMPDPGTPVAGEIRVRNWNFEWLGD